MFPDPIVSASADSVYRKQLCEDARELRQTAQQLRIASQNLRSLCRAAVSRAEEARATAERLAMLEAQALNCVT